MSKRGFIHFEDNGDGTCSMSANLGDGRADINAVYPMDFNSWIATFAPLLNEEMMNTVRDNIIQIPNELEL